MTNTTIDHRFIAEAREVLAAECDRRDCMTAARNYRAGRHDNFGDVIALARLRQALAARGLKIVEEP